MARYTGPSCKLCRREGTKLFLKGERCTSGKCALDHRSTAPGQHGAARKKVGEYGKQLGEIRPALAALDGNAAKAELDAVYVHPDLLHYAAAICESTRLDKNIALGASPRAMIAFVRVAMGYAALDGRTHVLPDDLKAAAVPVLAHRMVFRNSFSHRGDAGKQLIQQILQTVPVPSERIDFSRR